MKSSLKVFFIALICLSACSTKKIVGNKADVKQKVEVVSKSKIPDTFTVSSISDISKQDLLFHINKFSIKDRMLLVQVQYGGGCIKPHVFKLVTDGIIDKEGGMDFYLLHKTHDDMCKALLMEDLIFDLAQIYSLKSEVLSNIRLNKMPKIDLK